MVRHFRSAMAIAITVGMVGCSVSADEEDTEVGVGETQQASVGDGACATVSPLVSPDGRSAAIEPSPSCSITFQTYTSPDTSYDWSPNACGQTYIAQITGTTNRAFSFVIGDAGGALDATTCPLVGVVGAAHGLSVVDGQWHLIGKTVWHGEWVSGPLFTFCNFVKDSGSSDIPSATGTGSKNYSRVRVEGVSVGFIFKRRVSVGISYGPGPC